MIVSALRNKMTAQCFMKRPAMHRFQRFTMATKVSVDETMESIDDIFKQMNSTVLDPRIV